MHSTDRVRAFREAGGVRRFHTMPLVGGDYTVGKHSYDALSLLLILHPNPSLNLVKSVLWHDSGERWLGDMPASAKWDNKELATLYEAIEDQALVRVGAKFLLSADETVWLKAVDRLELWLYCLEQVHMGNRNLEGCCETVRNALRVMHLPVQVSHFINDWTVGRGHEHQRA